MKFNMELAGYVFSVEHYYPYVQQLCRDYMCAEDGEPVCVTREDIKKEQRDGGNFPDAYLESLALYRKLCTCLLNKDIILFHCSALAVDGKAFLFTAPSGTGKSTQAGLWRDYFGNRVTMINDDKPLIYAGEDELTVYGTPYGGKDGLQTNTCAPVSGIVVLRQANENVIRRLTVKEAYPLLLNQTYRGFGPDGLIRTMDLVERLTRVPVYELGCTISQEAVQMAYRALTERN